MRLSVGLVFLIGQVAALRSPLQVAALRSPLQTAVLRYPLPVFRAARARVAVMQLATDGDAEVDTGPDGEVLITLSSLDAEGRKMIDEALELRNKERILAGQQRYSDVGTMVRIHAPYPCSPGTQRLTCMNALSSP